MQDKTPLNIAIDDLNTEISRCKCNNEYEVGRSQALEAAKFILESLLPKEREFVAKIYQSGWFDKGRDTGNDTLGNDLSQFLNKLYIDK